MADTLVSTGWLAEHLGAPGVVVLDASKYLPTEPQDAEAEFRTARIPGALRFDVDAIADPETELPHMVPAPGRFARLAGALGIGNDSFVVFYDQKGQASAARGWWLMRLFGHENAAVLDGGLPKWLADGNTCESGAPRPVKPAQFRPDFRAARLRGIGDMLANLASGTELVLDARSAPRFAAQVAELRLGVRGGHIPGARNLPYTELLASDQTLLPPDALRARLAAAGVDGSRPVVTSCGTGVTAAILTLAMTLAGLPEGAVYDGSWAEWGGRADTPVET